MKVPPPANADIRIGPRFAASNEHLARASAGRIVARKCVRCRDGSGRPRPRARPWARLGGNACFITIYPRMEGQRGMYVVDIPPGGKLEPIRHLYEQMILILEGHGTTEVWQEGDSKKHVFEWGRGSVFSPPLNSWYRMYNLASEPAKFVAYNRAPGVFNEYGSVDFVFNCSYAFRDRFGGE